MWALFYNTKLVFEGGPSWAMMYLLQDHQPKHLARNMWALFYNTKLVFEGGPSWAMMYLLQDHQPKHLAR